jgi:formylglycine-generating enzyme required for sulfatase activity
MKRMVAIFLILLVLLTACGSGTVSMPTLTPTDAATETPIPPTNTPEPTATPTLAPGDTAARESDGMVMVYVPEGEFIAGIVGDESRDTCPNYFEDLSPHTVSLDAFWIDQTEVTWEQYLRCVEAGVCEVTEQQGLQCMQGGFCGLPTNPDDLTGFLSTGMSIATVYQPSGNVETSFHVFEQFANFPAVYVNWYDAQTYCEWAGGRLPTSAEWEKAARGTDGRSYPWGETGPDGSLANYNDDQSGGTTMAVGSYPTGASPYGVLDMAGNVSEWVADWAGAEYNPDETIANPQGPEEGTFRVLRGSSWFRYSFFLHVGCIEGNIPTNSDITFGFRCASSEMP